MRILIDLRPLETPSGRRGIGRYTRELTRAVRAAAPGDWRIAGLSWSGQGKDLGIEDVLYPGPRRGIGLADRFLLPGLLRRETIDLYHATAYALPSAGAPGTALVLTVHDLVADIHPRALSLRHRLAFRRTFRSARVADRVVTNSQTTRREILARYRLDPARVVAVPIGVAAPFRAAAGVPGSASGATVPPAPAGPSAAAGDPGFRRPFLLYVGGLDPLKNVPFLLRVLDHVRRADPEVRLVIAGEEGARLERLRREAERTGVGRFVDLAGHVGDAPLAAAYAGAAAFVFPSRYEGFGLPPLEAMAAGCPVVSSPAGALREVLGDAARLCDPDDPEEWSRAILPLLRDQALRARQVEAGRARAASFTWDSTARATIDIYGAAVRSRRAA